MSGLDFFIMVTHDSIGWIVGKACHKENVGSSTGFGTENYTGCLSNLFLPKAFAVTFTVSLTDTSDWVSGAKQQLVTQPSCLLQTATSLPSFKFQICCKQKKEIYIPFQVSYSMDSYYGPHPDCPIITSRTQQFAVIREGSRPHTVWVGPKRMS